MKEVSKLELNESDLINEQFIFGKKVKLARMVMFHNL